MTPEERRRDRIAHKTGIKQELARWQTTRLQDRPRTISHAAARELHSFLAQTTTRERKREQAVMHNSLRIQEIRAREYGNTPQEEMLTEQQWRDLLERFHHRCAYCGHESKQLTIDHILSQSQGGKHTLSNVVPACMSCNSAKRDRTPIDWIVYLQTTRRARMKGDNVEWIIRMCTDSEEFRQALQTMMGVGDGTPEQVAQAFVEWVQERTRKPARKTA